MPQDRMYAAVDVSHRYSPRGPFVLQGVSVAVRRGAVHGVLGHNGAGKSTLLGVLAGRVRPTQGHLEEAGERVVYRSPREALEHGVATVYQELSVVASLSVADNLLVGRPDRAAFLRSGSKRRAFVGEALDRVGLGPRYIDKLVGELRFGERQQVEMARALSRDSRYVLLDEPTAGLDDTEVRQLFGVLRNMTEGDEGVGILMVNHHVDQVLEVAERYSVLRDGVLVAVGDSGSARKAEVVASIVGEEPDSGPKPDARSAQVPGSPVRPGGGLVRGLSERREPGGLGLEDISAEGVRCRDLWVGPGEVHGLYGLEGAGQDVVVALLAGEQRIHGGRVSLGAERLGRSGSAGARRRGVLFLSGDRARMIIPQLSVIDNVVLPRIARQGLTAPFVARRSLEQAARAALTRMDVRGDIDGTIQSLSGGNQQKAVIARALIEEFRLLLMLEPTVGVDLGARRKIIEAIREIARDRNVPVLVASSDEDDLLEMCDRITVFRAGRPVSTVDVGQGADRAVIRNLALTHETTIPREEMDSGMAVGLGSGGNHA